MEDLFQEFQELLLSDNANYPLFIPKVIANRKNAEGLTRVQLASLERLAIALRDFPEQRSRLGDLSILIRQFIRFNQRNLYVLPEVWSWISSRAHEFHLWGLLDTESNSVEIGASTWEPDWLSQAEKIDLPEICRSEPTVIGDGLLFSATGKSTYLSQAQKNAVIASLTLPPGDTLLVSLPTGAGKSLCILLPPWQDSHGGRKAGGTTLVVVPTVALAYDQERRALDHFNHSLSDHHKPWSLTGATIPQNRAIIREALKEGTLPLLFTSPESLLNSEIYNICLDAAKYGKIKRIVIDEAHIIESWGADFRAEFQYLSTFRKNLLLRSHNSLTTILLSATITKDCEVLLEDLFSEEGHFHSLRGNRLRSEISYWFSYSKNREQRKKQVFEAIHHLPRPLILFVNKPSEAETLVEEFRNQGFFRIAAFSGNTSNEERARILSEWSQNHLDLIVATSAFGLGVDKADVRTVIHAAFPESIDRFYQEVGRGGRDGISSISLVCAAEGDQRESFSMIKTSRITTEKAVCRWDAMRNYAKFIPPSDMIIDLNAKPSYNLDLLESERHRDWNIHVLLMMQRAGMIQIKETQIAQITNGSLSVEETREKDQGNSFLINIEVLNPIATNDLVRLKEKINVVRKKEISCVIDGLSQLVEMVNAYTMDQAKLCISKSLSMLYPAVSEACGGCPVCRREKRKPYSTPLNIVMDLQTLDFNITYVDSRLQPKLGAHHTLNVFWDYLENVNDFKRKNELFANLIKMGFRQIILPDEFFDDPTWIREACTAFATQDQVIHQIIPHRAIRNQKMYFLLPLASVILYPNRGKDADILYKELEKLFFNLQAIPRINIVHRRLYLPSLSGLFLDKVNGLSESLNHLEESLSEQIENFDF